MVRGVEKFKEYFRDYAGQYTFIGGTACDIILFKIKAWLDLSERRENGEHIDSKNIKKHKNDIMRLGASIEKGQQLQISGRVREDVEIFMDKVKNEPIDLKNLNLRNVTFDEVMNSIKECYGLYYL